MNVLVIDVGGTNVKVLAPGQTQRRKIPSGPVTDGGGSQGDDKRLGLRCCVNRISRTSG